MLEDLDPYTVYWNEQEVEDARIKIPGTYTELVLLRTLKDKILIMEPFKGYPADEAGLKRVMKSSKLVTSRYPILMMMRASC